MRKIIFGFLIGVFLATAATVSAAPSLAQRLQGKILLAVEDKGKTYYVHTDGKRYRVTRSTAFEIFKRLAVGINNANLAKIPEGNLGVDPESFGSECPSVSTPTPVNPTAPITISNTGQRATEKFYLRKGLAVFNFSHVGSLKFYVTLLNEKGEYIRTLVMAGGNFEGSTAEGISTAGYYLLDVNADGQWSVVITQS